MQFGGESNHKSPVMVSGIKKTVMVSVVEPSTRLAKQTIAEMPSAEDPSTQFTPTPVGARDDSVGFWSRLVVCQSDGGKVTGPWQTSGRTEINFKDTELLDLYYIENQSVMFDLEILFAAIPIVFFGRGAY